MATIVEKINSLPGLLSLKAASAEMIADAELQLRVSFAADYKEYLSIFGAIIADGIELTGIAKSEYRNVVFQTKQERSLNPIVPHTMYVIENTHIDGIIIWQDTNGDIYQTSPNTKPQKIASSLAEYLSLHLAS